MNSKYSEKENTFITMNAESLTDPELAFVFSKYFHPISVSALRKQRHRLGIKKRTAGPGKFRKL